MVADAEEVLEKLLYDVAFAGPKGLSIEGLTKATRGYYENTASQDPTIDSIKNNDEQGTSTSGITSTLVSTFWQRLLEHPDVHLETDDQNPLLQDSRPESAVVNLQPASSNHSDHSGQRLAATTERIWQAVAGHGIDYQRIPAREFELLLAIAAHGSAGILQADLAHSTGQDIRSVPKRTDLLAAKDHIVKDGVMVKGRVTSLLRLKRFAGAAHSILIQPLQHDVWFDGVVRSLENRLDRRMVLQDLYIALGIRGKKTQLRQLRRCFDAGVKSGWLRQLTAMTMPVHGTSHTDEGPAPTLMRCIEMLRHPNENDRTAWDQANTNVQKRVGPIRKRRVKKVVADVDCDSTMGDDVDDYQYGSDVTDNQNEGLNEINTTEEVTKERLSVTISEPHRLIERSRVLRPEAKNRSRSSAQTLSQVHIQSLPVDKAVVTHGTNKLVSKPLGICHDILHARPTFDHVSSSDVDHWRPVSSKQDIVKGSQLLNDARRGSLGKFINRHVNMCKYTTFQRSGAAANVIKTPLNQNSVLARAYADPSVTEFVRFAQSTAQKLAQAELNRTHRFEDVDANNEPSIPSSERIAQIEAEILRQSYDGIYINPPGSAVLRNSEHALIAVFRCGRIKEFPWFRQTASYPALVADQRLSRQLLGSPMGGRSEPSSSIINPIVEIGGNDPEPDNSAQSSTLSRKKTLLPQATALLTPIRGLQVFKPCENDDTSGPIRSPVPGASSVTSVNTRQSLESRLTKAMPAKHESLVITSEKKRGRPTLAMLAARTEAERRKAEQNKTQRQAKKVLFMEEMEQFKPLDTPTSEDTQLSPSTDPGTGDPLISIDSHTLNVQVAPENTDDFGTNEVFDEDSRFVLTTSSGMEETENKPETFDKKYVESHQGETFHHRGGGRWARGVAPASMQKRKWRNRSSNALEPAVVPRNNQAKVPLISPPQAIITTATSSVDSSPTLIAGDLFPALASRSLPKKKKGRPTNHVRVEHDRFLQESSSVPQADLPPSLADKDTTADPSIGSMDHNIKRRYPGGHGEEIQPIKRMRSRDIDLTNTLMPSQAVTAFPFPTESITSPGPQSKSSNVDLHLRSSTPGGEARFPLPSSRSRSVDQLSANDDLGAAELVSNNFARIDAHAQVQHRESNEEANTSKTFEYANSQGTPQTLSNSTLHQPDKSTTTLKHTDVTSRFHPPGYLHVIRSDVLPTHSQSSTPKTNASTPESSVSANGGVLDLCELPKTGNIASRRKALILSIMNQAGGVFSGSKEMWHVFVAQWERLEPSIKPPNAKTVEHMLKTLENNGDLIIENFAFQSNGQSVIRKVIYLRGTSPSLVTKIKDKIREAYPGHFLPDGISLSSELRAQITQKSSARGSKHVSDKAAHKKTGPCDAQLEASSDYPLIEGLSVQRTAQGIETIRAERLSQAVKKQVIETQGSTPLVPLRRPTGRLSRLLPLKLSNNLSLGRNMQQGYLPSQAAHSLLVPQYYTPCTLVSKTRLPISGPHTAPGTFQQWSIDKGTDTNTPEVTKATVPSEPLPRKKYKSRKRKVTDIAVEPGLDQAGKAQPAAKKQKTWSNPFQDVDRLVTAIALVRCLCSGYTQAYTKWPIVAHALRFRYSAQKLQQSWNFQKQTRLNDVVALENALREPLLEAYERGEVSKIDFQNLEHTDWAALYDWVDTNIAAPLRDKEQPADTTKPAEPNMEDTLEALTKRFQVVEPSKVYEPERNAFYLHPTSNGRTGLIVSYVYTDALPLENEKSEADDQVLLKSWCRAVIATKDWKYDAKAAAEKIGEFPTSSIKRANSELVKAHVLQPSKKSRLTPGRSYHFHESFWKVFKRWSVDDYSHLRDVADFFVKITSEIEQTGHYQLQLHAGNAEVTALTNLVGIDCIRMKTILPERNDDFEAPFPRLSAFGYLDYNYDTKKMDRTRLRFPIIYEEGSKWTQSHGLESTPVPTIPDPFPGDGERRRLPLWIDIHGHLIDDLWDLTLRSVLHVIVFRPGFTSVMITKAHQGKLWQWEVDIVLKWMDDAGVAQKWGAGHEFKGVWQGGWRASRWWFCAFAPDVAMWKTPKPPKPQLSEAAKGVDSSG